MVVAQQASGSGRLEVDEDTIMPQRVWILMGGDSSERSASLASGVAAWLRLKTQSEVTAELFMLAPRNAGISRLTYPKCVTKVQMLLTNQAPRLCLY